MSHSGRDEPSLKMNILTVSLHLILLLPPQSERSHPDDHRLSLSKLPVCNEVAAAAACRRKASLAAVTVRCSLHFVVALGKSQIAAEERSRAPLKLAVKNLKLAARDGCVKKELHHSFRDMLPKNI